MVFTDLLKLMVLKNASDLFITAGVPPCLKVDGKITPVTKQALTPDESRSFAYGIMNEDQRRSFEEDNECNFAIHPKKIGRFRVNVFVQQGMVGMVLRTIETRIPKFEELNLPPVLSEIAMVQRGLVLFVGGTGTGKSTSLAALIGYRNENSFGHIITIEDPIEYIHEHRNCVVTQREVGVDTDTFESGLVNAMRQAPDVILIGEIRTRDTMEKAVIFSETGHLCLATLHANNTYQALERILNFFPEERHNQLYLDLSMNLHAIISQRLLRKRGDEGRVPAIEIMIRSPLIAEMILKGRVSEIRAVIAKSTDSGMQTFDQSLFQLFEDGLIDYEDAIRAADSGNDLRLRIKLESSRNESGELGDSLTDVSFSSLNQVPSE
ncbi:MAG TPA: PilT/PilU family type 4a pilus ATPase [Gammaproteobacteria bacterium]|nr:PilT/PilU family type 4a pilus ATPase [Gammaproteobacteria bacterium]